MNSIKIVASSQITKNLPRLIVAKSSPKESTYCDEYIPGLNYDEHGCPIKLESSSRLFVT